MSETTSQLPTEGNILPSQPQVSIEKKSAKYPAGLIAEICRDYKILTHEENIDESEVLRLAAVLLKHLQKALIGSNIEDADTQSFSFFLGRLRIYFSKKGWTKNIGWKSTAAMASLSARVEEMSVEEKAEFVDRVFSDSREESAKLAAFIASEERISKA